MDIFFCDECASRVTDADLRRGFGIRKADVVVCGSCVEEGRGAEILANAGSRELEKVGAQPALMGAGVLDEARDRAQTTPDRSASTDGADPAEQFLADVSPEDDTDPLNHAVAPSKPSDSSGLSAMASGLGALNNQDQVADDRDEDILDQEEPADDVSDDELELDPEPEFDDEPELDDEPAAVDEAESDPEPNEEPEDELDPTDLDLSEDQYEGGKADTEEVEPVGAEVPKPAAPAAPSKEASSAMRRRGGKSSGRRPASSTRKTKAHKDKGSRGTGSGSRRSKTTSTRRVAAKKNNNTLIYGISFATIGILLIAIVVVLNSGGSGGGRVGPTTVDPTGDLRAMSQSAYRQATEARRANDLAQLKAARAAIFKVTDAVDDFEKEAKRQGRTADEISRILDRTVRLDELMSHIRAINDQIQVLEAQKGL